MLHNSEGLTRTHYLSKSLFVGVFNDYCNEHLPDLYEKLKNLGVAACISLSWFLTLFIW